MALTTVAHTRTISIVVPAFNEARRITGTLDILCDYLRRSSWDWEVRVVDDGSSDDTARLASAVALTEPRIVVQREPHGGKGAAVKAGLCAARGAYRFMCDADLSMSVDQIERFLPLGGPSGEVVIATREGAGARRVGEPFYRHAAGRVFNVAVQHLLLKGVQDSQCGFKLFTQEAVAAIFPSVSITGWGFDLEVLAVARVRGLRIVEVPIEWHYRPGSRVRIARDAAGMLRELWAIRRRVRTGVYGRPTDAGWVKALKAPRR